MGREGRGQLMCAEGLKRGRFHSMSSVEPLELVHPADKPNPTHPSPVQITTSHSDRGLPHCHEQQTVL